MELIMWGMIDCCVCVFWERGERGRVLEAKRRKGRRRRGLNREDDGEERGSLGG